MKMKIDIIFEEILSHEKRKNNIKQFRTEWNKINKGINNDFKRNSP